MSLEQFTGNLIADTQEKYSIYYRRLGFVSKTLVAIQNSFLIESKGSVVYNNTIFYYDDFLVLYFEFTVLISVFPQFSEQKAVFECFLSCQFERVSNLLLNGRLTHLSSLIEFRDCIK